MIDDNIRVTVLPEEQDKNKRTCSECGEVKSDVKFRTWDGIDAAEWDILCASCLEKKEREMRYFWGGLGICIVMFFGMLMILAYGFIIYGAT